MSGSEDIMRASSARDIRRRTGWRPEDTEIGT
jgi:hypothetical protein